MEAETKSNLMELDLTKLDKALENYKADDKSLLIPALQAAQSLYGYLPTPVLDRIGEHFHIPPSRVYGVATFYAQFHFIPHGRNTIRVCRGTSCYVRGGKAVLQAVEQELNIKDGETTPDMEFSIETVACLGTCFLSPVMMINNKYFGKLTPKQVGKILEQYQ